MSAVKIKVTTDGLRESRWYEYVVRFVFGGTVTALAGIIAKRFGPEIGGLFLAFPAIFPATATLIEKHERRKKEEAGQDGTARGRAAAGVDAAGAAMGSVGLAVFAIVVWARTAEIDSGHCTDYGNACMAGNLRERLATPRELMEASPRTSFSRFGRYAEYIRARHAVNEKGEQMSKNRRVKGGLADPSRLRSLDRDDGDIVQVVIETPKGSRNKYAFDPDQKVFELKKVLPAGMTFPYDFGFIPRTKAEDGDPVDILVLMDEPAFPGCVLKCRLIGIIQGEQGDKKDKERNDRIVGVEKENHSFADIKHIDDLGKVFLRELEEFFVNYHRLSDEQFRVIDVRGPGQARKRIEDGIRAARER